VQQRKFYRTTQEAKMFGIGVPELAIILVMVLIVFGAKKLPGIGGGLGKGIRNFKKELSEPKSSAAGNDHRKVT
jgi:sec-independent protein translocase protein TatA